MLQQVIGGGAEDISNLEPIDSEDNYHPKPPKFLEQKHRVLPPYPGEGDGNIFSNQSLIAGEEEKKDEQNFDLKAIGKKKKVELNNKLQLPSF
jgi:hypothetical protein